MTWLNVDVQTLLPPTAISTSDLLSSAALDTSGVNEVTFCLAVTFGDVSSLNFGVEFSPDGTNWYVQTIDVASNSGVGTFPYFRNFAPGMQGGAPTSIAVVVPVKSVWTRVIFQGQGSDGSGSSLSIVAQLGRV